ncbi:Mg2+ and Co2+ transporter CorA [Rhodoblastus acidophilus]|uniref:CorA family divalent cation transporter n=1 Tax=Rhodoblastus acidophilus TaxID=1074 RepID=UPI002224B646|nr:CorA family divalent cation transporter [Rhodoblastus acidophilus]MCW2285487.1 Mg2+ and Co2+ transporter CorA [Rhodoblastus acidophilus]MCW2334429.1 Mg2+ and Co2+ transporter CorA [Rhodoblastus acidophilus]
MSVDRLKPALETGLPGCVWIIRFDASGHAEPGTADDLRGLGTSDAEGFIWAHLDHVDRRIDDILHHIPTLSQEARDALSGQVDHQFVERAEGVVSGAIIDHQIDINGARMDSDFLRFACGPRFLITARRAALYSAQTTRRALAQGAKVESPGVLLEMLASHICDCTMKMCRAIAKTLDQIEDNVVIEGRGRDQRAGLGRARRQAVRMARQVSGLHSTFERMEEEADEQRDEEFAAIASGLGQRAASLTRDVNNLQDRARMLQDEINAILTLETNDRLYLLTLVTAVLLPATFVTGYFGMNTKNLPFAESDHGSLFATLVCIAAAAGTLIMLMRWGLAAPDAKTDKTKTDKPKSEQRDRKAARG